MQINGITTSIQRTTNFGLLTRSAENKLKINSNHPDFYEYIMNKGYLRENKNFILDYDKDKDKYTLYSTDYQASFVLRYMKKNYSVNDLLGLFINKAKAMEKNFPVFKKREQKLTVKEFN